MRWIWSGLLMTGLLLVLWGVFDTPQAATPDPMRTCGEDGTPVPPPPIRPPS
jgi:hypothetical protein